VLAPAPNARLIAPIYAKPFVRRSQRDLPRLLSNLAIVDRSMGVA
jgi:hypothetical protein